MPSYAVLGATGNTGQALLHVLSQSVDNTIHAYCRLRSKLGHLSPGLIADPKVRVFEGALTDTNLLRSCIKDTRAVFMAVAVTGNVPGNTTAQDTARVVVKVLDNIRHADPTAKLPKLIVLSSSAIDDRLARNIASFARNLLLFAESNLYNDLIEAEKFLRTQLDWLAITFIKPGALSFDVQRGHIVSEDVAESPVSFLDLAAGMVEVADREDERYVGKNVGVNPARKGTKIPWYNAVLIVKGLLLRCFPGLYEFICAD